MKEYTLFLTFFTPYNHNIPPTIPNTNTPIEFDKVATILEFLSQEYDSVRLVGGEPLTIPFINDIIDLIAEYYSKLIIETYGAGDSFRTGYNLKHHISSGLDVEVLIQIVDIDPNVNDRIVGRRAWENAISTATLLDSTFGISPKIVVYVGSHSTHKYGLILNLGYEVVLRRAYGMKITNRTLATMFQLGDNDMITVEDCVYNSIVNGINCLTPKLILDANGNIYTSRFVPTGPVGNIFGKTMDDLMTIVEEAYRTYTEAKLHGKCARCAYSEICRGGDPNFWQSPDRAFDPVCPIREEVLEEVEEAPPEEATEEPIHEDIEIEEEPVVDETEIAEVLPEDDIAEE